MPTKRRYYKPEKYVPTDREVNFADAIMKGYLGISFKEVKRLLSLEKKILKAKVSAEASLLQAVAEKQTAEVIKQKAEAKRVAWIHNFHDELNLPADRIAQLMELELYYVVSILEKKPEKPEA